jgi:hypothetical protein
VNFRLPNDSQHLAVVGKNGTGKTQFGAWALSRSTFTSQPKVIIEHKGDELLAQIEGVEDIDYSTIPKKPGLYRLFAEKKDDDAMNDWLYRALRKENIGIYVDEGLEMPREPRYTALRSFLTQGRSKRCPATMLVQRPFHVSKFLFSEASFFAVFRLQDQNDQDRIHEFTPDQRKFPLWNLDEPLPKYYCRWYDSDAEYSAILSPVPSEDEILQTFYDRLRLRRRLI